MFANQGLTMTLSVNQSVEHLIPRLSSDGTLDEFKIIQTNVERVRWMMNNHTSFECTFPLPTRCLTGLKKTEEEAKQLRLAGRYFVNAMFAH